jgi:outer membrane murein-binding lipoprotein Lpp
MRHGVAAAVLILSGCAAPCPQMTRSPAVASLADQGYALAGQVDSLLAAGKLAPATAIRLNGELQKAQTDLRAGDSAGAAALIQSVRGELP